ncbi:Transposable element P transposase [Paramuricea clavata]|uniref:Transposable element P transposase n=1 Tax=Paramuricea clavata TaxID=317549 RepID=A0A7D9EQA3_PARCT|nr:Transposable element P transposase [Paramuricea clavata]
MLCENCSFYGCSNSRKNPKVSFLKIPTVKNTDSDYTKDKKIRSRLAWIKCLTRTRVLDADLQRQIDENTIHICEIHFKEDIIRHPMCSTLVTGSIPSENLPSRLHDAPDPVSRRPIVRVVEMADSVESKRATNSSLKSVVSNLKRMVLELYTFCAGVPKPNCAAKTVEDPSGPQTSGKNIIVRHTIPVIKDADTDTTAGDVQPLPFKVCTFFRTEKCEMLCQASSETCNSCSAANDRCLKELEKKNSIHATPLPKKAPLSLSSVPCLVATISQQRLECKQLEERIKHMEK